MSKEQAEENFRLADEEYTKLKPHASELCRTFLYHRSQNTSGDVDEASQRAAKRLIQREKQREANQRLRHVLGTTQTGIVARVETEVDGVVTEFSEQSKVEAAIMKNNEA